MGEMIAMIAHQWRQPLTTIKAAIDKMHIMNQLDKLSPEVYDKNHKNISEIISHMSQTIEDFRTFFDNKEKNSLTTLKQAIFKAIKLNQTSLNIKNIKLHFEGNGLDDKEIEINTSRFTQVLLNLIKNSTDELLEKGILIKIIKIEINESKNYYNIDFEDNAGGIPEEYLDKVFEPYFSTKSKNGTGLGLYMSKTIIEEHLHGKLEVSNSNLGAKFSIYIPKKKNRRIDEK